MEEQIREILSTASFPDADARADCERKLRSLMAGMKALESAYSQQQQVWSDGIARAEAAESRLDEIRKIIITTSVVPPFLSERILLLCRMEGKQ